MGWLFGAFALAVACLHPGLASNVKDINFDNYYAHWKENDVLFVEFFAPWCGHCKQLTPKWEEVADRLQGKALVAKVDATEDLEFAEEYGVKGYPAIKLFKRGLKAPVDYEGDREVEDMVRFAEAWMGECPTVLKSAEEVATHLATRGAVVGLFKGKGKERQQYTKLAEQRRGQLMWAVVDVAETTLPAEYTDAGVPSVRIATENKMPFGELPVHTFKGETLEAFIDLNKLPLVGLTWEDPALEKELGKLQRPIMQIYMKKDEAEALVKVLKPIAAEHQKKLAIVLRDADTHSSQMSELLITASEGLPRASISTPERKKYVMPEIVTEETLSTFITDYFNGKVRAFAKSQPPSEGVTVDGLTTLIGHTFHSNVTANWDKDIFTEFYAPWCGHCKSLAPIWEKVAKDLEPVETIIIAKMDATANDWDNARYPVSGYPTLYFRPALKSKKAKPRPPMKYDGARTEEPIMEFIRKNAVHPIPDPLPTASAAPAEEEKKEEPAAAHEGEL